MATPTPTNEQTMLVTGATDGIGYHTAKALAQTGARVIIVGRNPKKTASVVHEIRSATGNPNVDSLVADLSSQAQVRSLAEEFKARYSRLHVLVNNAGALFMRRELSVDGIEMTFALNHLGYFLLTILLLEPIFASRPARIINVSSAAHHSATLDMEDLQNERNYSAWKAYSRSKLANIYFSYELARRLDGRGVTVNALHPGFVATNFGKSNGGIFRPIFKLFHLAALDAEEGAKTSIHLALSPDVAEISGKYFAESREMRSSTASYDLATARRLWDASLKLTGLPEMMRIA